MINKEQIEKIISECKIQGSNIRVRDIAYILLCKKLPPSIAYQCLFMKEDGFDNYKTSPEITILNDYMKRSGYLSDVRVDTSSITFEENKEGLIQMLANLKKDLDEGVIEPKDYYRLETDIRVKLNDKFAVEQQEKERTIIVEKKFNNVCPSCHREIFVPTKEDLMEQYNLVEKK